jgi:sporulenol synthase
MSTQDRLRAKLDQIICGQEGINRKYVFDLLDKNPGRYLKYPYVFAPYFGLKASEEMDKLAIGGFIYYLNLLNFDRLFDSSPEEYKVNKGELLILSQFLVEESIKLFSMLFPEDHPFWESWNKRKRTFIDTVKRECSLSNESFSWTDYAVIANGKVAFAKAAIDACNLLTPGADKQVYKKLLRAHYELAVASQICDDISDVRKDIRDGQFNVAFYKYEQQFTGPSNQSFVAQDDIVLAIYRDGVAIDLFNQALDYIRRAYQALSDLPKGPFHQVIKTKELEVRQKIEAIQQFFYVEKKKVSLEQTLLEIQHPSTVEESIDKRVQRGVDFLLERLENTSWSEYITQAGLSTVWASSFITHQLKDVSLWRPRLSRYLEQVRAFLCEQQSVHDKLWGYSGKWSLPDADSSSLALLALSTSQVPDNDTLLALQNFQCPAGGGMRTYYQEEMLANYLRVEEYRSFRGWTQEHNCVSGATLELVSQHRDVFSEEFTRPLVDYCLSRKEPEGYWGSYWWSDPIYATYFCSRNLYQLSPTKYTSINQTLEWLVNRQEATGAWSDKLGNECFYTGLALLTLLETLPESYAEAIIHGVTYLCKYQIVDGSWPGTGALLVPHPSATSSLNESIGWPVKTFGTNVRSPEYQRLFTTSVCTAALYRANLVFPHLIKAKQGNGLASSA